MVKPNWDSIQLYFSGDDYFRDLIEAIEKAKDEIILESYIFEMDPVGIRLLQALAQAQGRGVKVQILVDGVGSFNWTWSLREFCNLNQLHFRVYHPIPLKLNFVRQMSWKNLRRLLLLLRKINKRNHRKVILIDREKAFLGSLNISQVHTEEFMGEKAWRDTGIQVSGPPVVHLRKICLDAWVTAKSERLLLGASLWRRRSHLKHRADEVLRLNSNLRWRHSLLRDLNRRMRRAEKRILITNAYFLPRRSVLRSLKLAAERGLEVGLCLPAVSDVPPVRWASRSLYNRLLRSGVRIYEYQPRMLHAKTLVIDDWATVGSLNLNHRSLTHDLEVEVVLNRKEWVDPILKQWETDISQSREITSEEVGKMSWLERVFARLIYWFRYWL